MTKEKRNAKRKRAKDRRRRKRRESREKRRSERGSPTVRLYHGTSAEHLSAILKNGVRPRGIKPSVWPEYESRPDCVYLTSAYGFYFAMAAYESGKKSVVFEIDTEALDKSLILPDEDFIAQGLLAIRHNQGEQLELGDVHNEVRDNLEDYIAMERGGIEFTISVLPKDKPWDGPPAWKASVTCLTTCCYKGIIPPSAIRRYVVFDSSKRPLLSAMSYNEGPFLNGKHEQYAKLTAWFFGDRKKLPRIVPAKFARHIDKDDPGRRRLLNPKWNREQRSRHGIEVVNMTKRGSPAWPNR